MTTLDLDALERAARAATPGAPQVKCTCDHCGSTFSARRHDVAKGAGRFCSASCKTVHANAVRWDAFRRTREEKLKAKILSLPRDGDCLIWSTSPDKDGYGRVKIDGRLVRAHRESLRLFKGEPAGERNLALHSCDNPSCVNPDHLRWGTTKENVADKFARGRQPKHMRPANVR